MKLKTKLPSLVGYADRPLLRGLATPRAAGLDLDNGEVPNGAIAYNEASIVLDDNFITFTRAS